MYKVTSTESHNEKATDFETKAMLYLLNYCKNSNEIHWVVVDFFNDVTGINTTQTSCIDLQSKGVKDICPSGLGKYSVTLFKNYLSEFDFKDYILFIEGVSKTIYDQIHGDKSFTINDLDKPTINSIINGLKKEAKKKTYIEDKTRITTPIIRNFLKNVTFVIDSHTKEEYIKDAVNYNSSIEVEDAKLRKIFKELRDKQASKKNNDGDGEEIEAISSFIYYDKYLRVDDIHLLILNRICFKDFLNNITAVPKYFSDIYSKIDETRRDEILEECYSSIMRILMNNNNRTHFWILFEEIVKELINDKSKKVDDIYDKIDKSTFDKLVFLDALSCKYLIALLKERIIDDKN